MVWGLKSLSEGPAAWAAFLELLRSPASIVFHLLTLAFAAYHSVTWFNLTPKALPLQAGEEFVPDWVIAGAHYAGWALLSAGILYGAGVLSG
jgi:fumarate reductase subunit C